MSRFEDRIRAGLHRAASNLPDATPSGRRRADRFPVAQAVATLAMVAVVLPVALFIAGGDPTMVTGPPAEPPTHPVMTAPSSTPPAYTKASPQAPDPATVLVSIDRAPEGLSAFQKILFDDGALTYGEVKEAARAMEECLTRAGFPDKVMWVDTGDARTFEWGWAAGGSEAGFRAASEVCRREYWEPLSTHVGFRFSMTAETGFLRPRTTQDLRACLAGAGIVLDLTPYSWKVWDRLLEAGTNREMGQTCQAGLVEIRSASVPIWVQELLSGDR